MSDEAIRALKPCPFCGREAAQKDIAEPFVNGWVGCRECRCFINWVKDGKNLAVDAWNKRDETETARLRSDLAAMTAERDAAVRDMQMAGWGNNCEVCAYFDEPDENAHCNACDGDPGHSGFEWRGPVAENRRAADADDRLGNGG